jgi:hypothetical protein
MSVSSRFSLQMRRSIINSGAGWPVTSIQIDSKSCRCRRYHRPCRGSASDHILALQHECARLIDVLVTTGQQCKYAFQGDATGSRGLSRTTFEKISACLTLDLAVIVMARFKPLLLAFQATLTLFKCASCSVSLVVVASMRRIVQLRVSMSAQVVLSRRANFCFTDAAL